MRLFEILKETDNVRVVASPATALLSGRPSAIVKDFRQRAESDPKGLLNDLGISPKTEDTFIKFINVCFTQMISSATGNKKARYIQDLFDKPEIVKSQLGKKKAVLVKLSGEGEKLAKKDYKKFLRTYAFWFSSTVEALERTTVGLNLKPSIPVKFQYISSEKAIIVYKSRNAWSSL